MIGQVLVKAGEENAGVIDVGEGWGWHLRSNRIIIRVQLNHLRVLPRESVGLFVIFLLWVPDRFYLPIRFDLEILKMSR